MRSPRTLVRTPVVHKTSRTIAARRMGFRAVRELPRVLLSSMR